MSGDDEDKDKASKTVRTAKEDIEKILKNAILALKSSNFAVVKKNVNDALDIARDNNIYVTQIDGFKKLEEAMSRADSDVTAQLEEVMKRYEKQKAEDKEKEEEKIKQARSMMSDFRKEHEKEVEEIEKCINVMLDPNISQKDKDKATEKALENCGRIKVSSSELEKTDKALKDENEVLVKRRKNARTPDEIRKIDQDIKRNNTDRATVEMTKIAHDDSLNQEEKKESAKKLVEEIFNRKNLNGIKPEVQQTTTSGLRTTLENQEHNQLAITNQETQTLSAGRRIKKIKEDTPTKENQNDNTSKKTIIQVSDQDRNALSKLPPPPLPSGPKPPGKEPRK